MKKVVGLVVAGLSFWTPRPGHAVKAASRPAREARPALEIRQGRYFRWASPAGWKETETANGVTLSSPGEELLASSNILMRAPGQTTPRDFLLWMFGQIPEYQEVKILSTGILPSQPGLGGPWEIQEFQMSCRTKNGPARAAWTVGIQPYFGTFNAAVVGYQAQAAKWEKAKTWLVEVARSIVLTNQAQAAGNDSLIPVRNNPLDNSALLETWRQKGLSEDRIAKAQREATSGYDEGLVDPQTGRRWIMPLEAYDATVGGYRNPARPTEILDWETQ
ncbi:MAG: hypothetical protein HY921_11770 [Elusimicrobia bacterium]|nr:hypothetical protein [Elusimicrobiota bacterium]